MDASESYMAKLRSMLNGLTKYDDPCIRYASLDSILRIMKKDKGLETIINFPELLQAFIHLMQHKTDACNVSQAALMMVDIAAEEDGTRELLKITESSERSFSNNCTNNLVHVCVRSIVEKDSEIANACCMILANMTRLSTVVNRIIALMEQSGVSWDSLMNAFTTTKYNAAGQSLDHLASVFNNLSVSADFRRYLMDKESCPIQRLLPFTEYAESTVRRRGIVGTLKNCCFDTDNHVWLLSSEIDMLPYILLPLAGPEEFDEEDNDKLPLDLQYLPKDKKRERDSCVRTTLLEILCQFCATKQGREILREKNTYVILRELHKWEEDRDALLACENVVDILIRTEEEIGVDNIKEIEVPAEYTEKFAKLDLDRE